MTGRYGTGQSDSTVRYISQSVQTSQTVRDQTRPDDEGRSVQHKYGRDGQSGYGTVQSVRQYGQSDRTELTVRMMQDSTGQTDSLDGPVGDSRLDGQTDGTERQSDSTESAQQVSTDDGRSVRPVQLDGQDGTDHGTETRQSDRRQSPDGRDGTGWVTSQSSRTRQTESDQSDQTDGTVRYGRW